MKQLLFLLTFMCLCTWGYSSNAIEIPFSKEVELERYITPMGEIQPDWLIIVLCSTSGCFVELENDGLSCIRVELTFNTGTSAVTGGFSIGCN